MGQEIEARQSGQVIGGKYLLERVLGAGGMGEVWSAKHTSLQTLVALKFLKGSSASEPEIRSRFELEARVTAQLKTRLAVQVFDYGVADRGEPFLVMELLEGESVAQRLHRFGRFTPVNALNLLAQAARALEKAHALGIVHRDFKPGNVFITIDEDYREQVKVMDFGLAKIMGELEIRSTAAAAIDDDASPSAFTRTGALLGTPSYMSPEQVAGSTQLGPATDVWALGVVAFECLTGQVPFTGKRMSDLFESIRGARHVKGSVLVPELTDAFDQWFAKICAIEPPERFTSPMLAISELAKALQLPIGADSGPISRGSLNSFGNLASATPMPNSLTPAPRPPSSDDAEGSEPTLRRGTTPPPSAPPFVQHVTLPQSAPIPARSNLRLFAMVGAGLVAGAALTALTWGLAHSRQDPAPVMATAPNPPPPVQAATAAPVPRPDELPPLGIAPPARDDLPILTIGGPPPGMPPPPGAFTEPPPPPPQPQRVSPPPQTPRHKTPAPKPAAAATVTPASPQPAPEPAKPKPTTGIEHTPDLGIH